MLNIYDLKGKMDETGCRPSLKGLVLVKDRIVCVTERSNILLFFFGEDDQTKTYVPLRRPHSSLF